MTAVLEHRRHGTTTLVGSLVTAAPSVLRTQLRMLVELCARGELAGVHVEGPFLAAARCGAQDVDSMIPPDRDLVRELLELGQGQVVSMTVAPELPLISEVVQELVAGGALPSFGHTEAPAAVMREAVESAGTALARAPGARSALPVATHLFNGMPPMHHRDPGPVPELLSAAARGTVVLELIADGVHLSPSLVRSVVEMVGADNVALVTDAMSATGMRDGAYRLGGREVVVASGVARRADSGSLAGGTAHLIDVVRCTTEAGVSLPDAVHMATLVPARVLGMTGVGSLRTGELADVVVTDANLHPVQVLRRGRDVSDDKRVRSS